MVLEPYHLGRQVPCPWCQATNEVPRELDFRTSIAARRGDEVAGSWLLAASILNLTFCGACLPLGAVLWWYTHGRIQRAADEGRPTDPMLKASRLLAALGVAGGVVLGAIFLVAGVVG